jgi:predicted tellurium resistance membrane protein TerC
VPLIIGGSRIVLYLIDRFPIIVTAGAGLLGWIAGGMMLSDPGVVKFFGAGVEAYGLVAGAVGAIAVMGLGEIAKRSSKKA